VALNKVAGLTHISAQAIASGNTVRSSAIDLSLVSRWALNIGLMRGSATAFASAAAAPRVVVYGSTKTTGDEDWAIIWEHLMQVGASIGSTSLPSNMTSNTTLSVSSASNFAAKELIAINPSGANFELRRIDQVPNISTIMIQLPTTALHPSATVVRGQAENPAPTLDVDGWRRGLIAVENYVSGQSINAWVLGSTLSF
jgi:hypothetical protein